MAKVDEKEFAQKWGRNLKSSTTDIKNGVDKVTENPMKKAIANKDKLKAHLIEAIDSGRWERQMAKITLDDWKKAMKEKGIGRISAGVDGAIGKMEEFGKALLSHVDAGQKAIAGMPDLTLEDNIARMEAFIRHMAKFKYK